MRTQSKPACGGEHVGTLRLERVSCVGVEVIWLMPRYPLLCASRVVAKRAVIAVRRLDIREIRVCASSRLPLYPSGPSAFIFETPSAFMG